MALAQDNRSDIYGQMLSRLAGIYAANVQMSEDGQIEEIHLLTSASRSPKQAVRDARSALITLHGVDVDHRKFSVAQLKDAFADQIEDAEESAYALRRSDVRLQCGQITQTLTDDRYTVRATLKYGERTFEGCAVGGNTPLQRIRTEAEAALAAIHQYLGRDRVFLLLTAQKVGISPVPVVVVLLECLAQRESCLLVGAAESVDNQAVSVMRATLDALNRKLSALEIPNCGGNESAR